MSAYNYPAVERPTLLSSTHKHLQYCAHTLSMYSHRDTHNKQTNAIYFMYLVYMYVYECMSHVCRYPGRPIEGIQFPGARRISDYYLPNKVAEDAGLVLMEMT